MSDATTTARQILDGYHEFGLHLVNDVLKASHRYGDVYGAVGASGLGAGHKTGDHKGVLVPIDDNGLSLLGAPQDVGPYAVGTGA